MTSRHSPLHIGVALDATRLPHTAAMLRSALTSTRGKTIHVHALHEPGLAANALQKLARFIESIGGQFHPYPVAASLIEQLPTHEYFARADWLRIFAPTLIECDRLLFLDAELIVREDLAPLWETPLDDLPLAAVHEGMWFNSTRYGVHTHLAAMGLGGADYFNSAVLLMDLAAMRRDQVGKALLDYARDPNQSKRLSVQDALNLVLRNRWKRLPMKWGAHKIVTMNHRLEVSVSDGELEEARYHPGIVHFCSPDKPWFPNSRHPFRPDYIRHRRRTPWSEGIYRQMDSQSYFYFRLPIALRVYLYGWVPEEVSQNQTWQPPRRGLWHYRYKLKPRYVAGALLKQLPVSTANRVRRLAGQPEKD